MSLQFRDRDVMQDSVKCFAQVKVDDITLVLPPFHYRILMQFKGKLI